MELIDKEQIRQNPAGGIFDSYEYLSTQAPTFGRIQEGPHLVSFIEKRHLGGFFRSITFTSAPLASEGASDFTNKLPQFIKESLPHVDFIAQSLAPALFPTIPPGASGIPFGTYCVNLNSSEDEILAKIHSKHRNVIRSAAKKGVEARCAASYLDASYKIIAAGYKRQGLSFYSFESVQRLLDTLKDHLQVWVALFENEIQATVILVTDSKKAFYLYGGTIAEPVTGSMNLLHWEAMRYLKRKGLLEYDFLGARVNVAPESKWAGIQKFKERFGGDFKMGMIWKYPIKKWKFALFYMLLRLRNAIKIGRFEGDAIDQELGKWQ